MNFSAIALRLSSFIALAFALIVAIPVHAQQPLPPPYIFTPNDGDVLHTSTPSLHWYGYDVEVQVDDDTDFSSPVYENLISTPTYPTADNVTFGSNWTATIYNNMSFSGSPTQIIRNVNGINFNWGSGPPRIPNHAANPVPGIGADYFSVRFTSQQNLEAISEFYISYDDFGRFLVDGVEVFSAMQTNLATYPLIVMLPPGTHTLTLERSEIIGDSIHQLQWLNNLSFALLPHDTVVLPPLADGVYYWRVRRSNTSQTGDWSEVRQFTIADAAPDLNLMTSNSVTLTWQGIANSTLYHAQISRISELEHWMTTGVIPELVVLTPDTSLNVDLPEGRYNWRVQAKNQAGRWSDWSVLETFTVDLP